MIDWDRLNSLRDDIGEEDFADVAFLFVAEMTENLDRLTADPGVANAGDFHFLRGSASNLGFEGMAKACSAAEAACKENTPPDIDAVSQAFRASMEAISEHIPGVEAAA